MCRGHRSRADCRRAQGEQWRTRSDRDRTRGGELQALRLRGVGDELIRVRVGGRPRCLYMCVHWPVWAGPGQATVKRAVGAAVPALMPLLGRAVALPCHGPCRRPMHCTGNRAVPARARCRPCRAAHGPCHRPMGRLEIYSRPK
jgi:hypothetical protein